MQMSSCMKWSDRKDVVARRALLLHFSGWCHSYLSLNWWLAWVFLCSFALKETWDWIGFLLALQRPRAMCRLHSGLNSTNICSLRGPSATFLRPSEAEGIIKLLLFILHSIFVSGLCHWDFWGHCRTLGNLWVFIQQGERRRGSYFSRDGAFPNPTSFLSPFFLPFPFTVVSPAL